MIALLAHVGLAGAALQGCGPSDARAVEPARDAAAPDASTASPPGPRSHGDAGAWDAGELTAPDAAEPAAPKAPWVERFPACGRSRNSLTALFCSEQAPAIGSLADLKQALGFTQGVFGTGGSPSVLLAHSTALSGHLISPINPRSITLQAGIALAFQRGVQQVELAVPDRQSELLRFYLLTFRQRCNDETGGCGAGDLYTPALESGWRDLALFDDEDLKNTASDCRQCHQRGLETPVLLMRELRAPWTHFFGPVGATVEPPIPGVTSEDLVNDYLAAWGDTPYAGLSREEIGNTIGFVLELAVPLDQPLLFDAPKIFDERFPWDPDTGYAEVAQRSETWDSAYEAFKRGEHLALPYFAGRATDLAKQAALSEAVSEYVAGLREHDEFPDLADIFPDDPQVRAEIGLQTEPGASPADTLIQACGPCHNDVLDQSISRARFNIDLSRMPEEERMLAIDRIQRVSDDPLVMPPREARQLDPGVRDALLMYLRQEDRPAEDNAALQRAAELGMAGNPVGTPPTRL